MLVSIIIYFLVSFITIFLITIVSYKLDFVDIPDKRKIHSKPVAFTGGIGICLIYIFALQYFDFQYEYISSIFSSAFLISLVGLLDDKYQLKTGSKLSLQVIPILFLVLHENLYLTNIGNYNYFEITLGSFGLLFTLLSVLFLTNAFNYFDGLDGTLSYSFISVLIILYFLLPKDSNLNFLILIIIIPLIIFLLFNSSIFGLPKLFLGDSGSLFLGFITSFLLILFAIKNLVHPILLAWSVVLFVYEFISINFQRINEKKNPFNAGLDHLHHALMKNTKSLLLTNFYLFTSNLSLFFIGYYSYKVINPFSSIMLFAILFIFFFIIRKKILK